MKAENAEYDNTCDITYRICNILPKLKCEGKKDEYNNTLDSMMLEMNFPLNTGYILLCDSLILRCVDMLHFGEQHKTEKHMLISHGVTRNTGYRGKRVCASCTLTRKKPLTEKTIVYSSEEKLMLYIFISTYLNRIVSKKIKLSDNLTYISLKDIHAIFGNKNLKSNKRDYYIDIINKLISDDIEIYIGDDKHNPDGPSKYTSWFKYIKEVRDYEDNIIGYVYSFGDLGTNFFDSTNHPNVHIRLENLSVNNRNYKEFEMARYLLCKILDKSKKITIITIMQELYDYQRDCSYLKAYEKLKNPNDRKYLNSFINSLERVVRNLQGYYNLKIYVVDDPINIDDIKIYSSKEYIHKLNIRIASKNE